MKRKEWLKSIWITGCVVRRARRETKLRVNPNFEIAFFTAETAKKDLGKTMESK